MTIPKKPNLLRAGAARTDITPPLGTHLCGFIARLSPATGIADPLHSRAVVISSGDASIAIVQLDLLGLASWQVTTIKSRCRELLGIPPERVLISATHTHSAPGLVSLRGGHVAPYQYQWLVVDRTIAALRKAYATRKNIRLAAARVPFRMGINRRQDTPDGVVLGVAPEKPAPRSLDVLVARTSKRDLFYLFSHAAHPYMLGGESTLVSGDFPSLASAELERTGAVALFLNGCAGNIAPERAFQGLQAAREEGQRLSAAVRDAAHQAIPLDATPIAGFSSPVHLPYRMLPSAEQIRAIQGQQERTVRPEERSNDVIQERIRAAMGLWATEMHQVLELRRLLEPVLCEVQVLRMGDLQLVGFAGEPFFEIGEQVTRAAKLPYTWALGYCNAYCGYVPTRRAFSEGGYEVNDSYRYLGTWQIDPSCEQRVVRSARDLMRKAAQT
ncbi:MAG: hypothetical protein ACE14L_10435 [Terriglobales bacterium]